MNQSHLIIFPSCVTTASESPTRLGPASSSNSVNGGQTLKDRFEESRHSGRSFEKSFGIYRIVNCSAKIINAASLCTAGNQLPPAHIYHAISKEDPAQYSEVASHDPLYNTYEDFLRDGDLIHLENEHDALMKSNPNMDDPSKGVCTG